MHINCNIGVFISHCVAATRAAVRHTERRTGSATLAEQEPQLEDKQRQLLRALTSLTFCSGHMGRLSCQCTASPTGTPADICPLPGVELNLPRPSQSRSDRTAAQVSSSGIRRTITGCSASANLNYLDVVHERYVEDALLHVASKCHPTDSWPGQERLTYRVGHLVLVDAPLGESLM
jgi:hypothetical protein